MSESHQRENRNTSQDVNHNPTNAPRTETDAHVPHHISEFGAVDDLRYINDGRTSDEHNVRTALNAPKDRVTRERWARLRHKLFTARRLQQYFDGDTLYRAEGNRAIGADELFLDLTIVGAVAALGHELRAFFDGWRAVEKFILLFGAVFSSWRSVVFVWNFWGVSSDLLDKAGIYLVFFSLTGIAVGAHGAFDDGIRPYVSTCAFAATAIPSLTTLAFGLREPRLRNDDIRVHQSVITMSLSLLSVTPYLLAAFVSTAGAARGLYWAALVLMLVVQFLSNGLSRVLNGRTRAHRRAAVAIELVVEKYETLTMIVLGESVLGILFESELVVLRDGVRISALYGCVAAAAAMLYALQTLYHNVDGAVLKQGKHAIRHNRYAGMLWSQLHFPYHASLVMCATGIGIALRDIAIPPSVSNAGVDRVSHVLQSVARAGAIENVDGAPQFGRKERWLFAAGWSLSMVLSGIIGGLHLGGPRAKTRWARLLARCVAATALALRMPFADISAEGFVLTFALVLVVFAVAEYVLVAMDRTGFFSGQVSTASRSLDGVLPHVSADASPDGLVGTTPETEAEPAVTRNGDDG